MQWQHTAFQFRPIASNWKLAPNHLVSLSPKPSTRTSQPFLHGGRTTVGLAATQRGRTSSPDTASSIVMQIEGPVGEHLVLAGTYFDVPAVVRGNHVLGVRNYQSHCTTPPDLSPEQP
jgi:hypothetical protein